MGIYSLFFRDESQKSAARSFDIKKAEAYYHEGDYFRAVNYIERHRMEASLPASRKEIYYPMPKKYYDCVIKYLPPYVRMLSAEERKEFILLIFSMMHRESSFNEHAYNRKSGAMGLLQILPRTARSVAYNTLGMRHYDLYNYEDNIRIGMAYLSYLLERFGGLEYLTLNLANWNYGEGHVEHLMNTGNDRPLAQKIKGVKETRIFLAKVKGFLKNYRAMYGSMVMAAARGKTEFKSAPHEQPHVQKYPVVVHHPQRPKVTVAAKPKSKHEVLTHAKPVVVRHAPATGKYRVQLASFQNAEHAKKFKDQLFRTYNQGDIHLIPMVIDQENWVRVQVWFDDENKAKHFLQVMKDRNYSDAWLMHCN